MSTTATTRALPPARQASIGDYLRQFAVIVATLSTLSVNGLANALPINGQTTGEISDSFPVYFVPAGYVFSIWGLIYLGLLAYTVYQALPVQRTNPRLRLIGWPYVISAAANSIWIFLWHYEQFAWTVVVMFILLASLILIYARLAPTRGDASRAEWWTTHLTFSVYLGWITVATVANITVFLYDMGWNGGGIAPELWTVTMLVVAAGLGLFFGLRQGDVGYMAVLIWAFAGIAVRQSATPFVAWSAWMLAVVLAVTVAVTLWRRMAATQARRHMSKTHEDSVGAKYRGSSFK